MATILDIIDNFFGAKGREDILYMPGSTLYELGDEVRRFNTGQARPTIDQARHPVYLGGWPSANFWLADQGALVLSSLLYCGQVLAKDPVSNWFALEQYRLSHKQASRPGFRNMENEGKPAVAETRQFLSVVVPALRRLRPLIESGALVLAPSEAFLLDERGTVRALKERLVEELAARTMEVVAQFSPIDLAVEDNVRGMFVFAGGDRAQQLRRAIADAAEHFAREYVLATLHETAYVAPFSFEQYLCEQCLDKLLLQSPGQKVVHALLNSPLPLYSGLSPQVVSSIRDDENYANFRAQLYDVYRDVPLATDEAERSRWLAEAEEALLRPSLDRAKKEVERGALGRMGVEFTGLIMKFGVSLAVASAMTPETGLLGVGAETGLREGLERLARALVSRAPSGDPVTVWQKLYAHNRHVEEELRSVEHAVGQNEAEPEYWGIAQEPSMSVTISQGALITDFLPRFPRPQGTSTTVYRECDCGSAQKYKFCCLPLERSFLA